MKLIERRESDLRARRVRSRLSSALFEDMVSITVKPRGGKRSPYTVDLKAAAPTVSDLKQAIASKAKVSPYVSFCSSSDQP